MTIPRSASQIKYELLEENKSTAVKSSHLWFAVLLTILVICSSIIALFTTWQHMVNAAKEKENLDFLMYGPKRSSVGLSWVSNRRGEMYGQAAQEMSRWSDEQWELQEQELAVPRHTDIEDYKRVCYYNLPNCGSFDKITPDMVPPDLCTHINIAFATVSGGIIQPIMPADIQGYNAINALKKKNPKLKVMLSVEWFSSTGEFAWVVSSSENRTWFAEKAVQFLMENKLDGLDIDWEFPSWPMKVENQTDYFMELLKELSERFRAVTPPLLLSVAAAAPKPIIDNAYNITLMEQYIDFVNVMAYDYHMYQSYLPLTGANAPLYERKSEKGYFTTLNLNWTAGYWLYKGMPSSKIILGIPTYGHSFTLVNEENHGWEAPCSGVGNLGSDGFVSYYDICSFIKLHGAQSVFDYESKVPYAFKNKEWISFENEQSVAYKAEFAKQHQFGGVMIYSLNTDDVTSACGGSTQFPLAERIKNVLQDDQL